MTADKLALNERHNAEQSKMLRELLSDMGYHFCANCHHQPVVFAAGGGLCAECADVVIE